MKDTEAMLTFVTAQEAADWPEGCQAVLASQLPCGTVRYSMCPHWLKLYAESGYTGYLRLPETGLELEGKDG